WPRRCSNGRPSTPTRSTTSSTADRPDRRRRAGPRVAEPTRRWRRVPARSSRRRLRARPNRQPESGGLSRSGGRPWRPPLFLWMPRPEQQDMQEPDQPPPSSRPTWRCGRFTYGAERVLVMGILNLTPDSFSDGGRYPRPVDAIAAAHAMIDDGADILDLGAESTRPGAMPTTETEELDRLLPVLDALRGAPVALSVDTRRPAVMRAALA